MQRNEERRGEHDRRVPIRGAVELADNHDDAFAADAVNLSRGGISLRSQCLPDVGSRLWCRFEHPPSGSIIEAEGEVVWAQLEGEASGEIGLAFTSLDPQTELLIEQIIAQHGSPTASGEAIDPGEHDRMAAELDAAEAPEVLRAEEHASLPPAPRARVANLSLEGIPEPLSAQVAELSRDYAVFEQVLPLLKLGRSVSADAPELLDRRGVIAGVELRMMGHVPTLAVIVEFTDGATGEKTYGEASFSGTDLPALPSDTEPDLEAPAQREPEAQLGSDYKRVTDAEFRASPVSSEPRQLALDVSPAPRTARSNAVASMPVTVPDPVAPEEALPAALASSAGTEHRPSARGEVPAADRSPVRSSRLDPTQVVELAQQDEEPGGDDEVALDDPFAPAPPAWKPYALAAIRALHALTRGLVALAKRGALLLGASGVAALPHVRMFLVRAHAVLGKSGAALGPKIGAARRLAAAQLGKKRRRTTTGGASAARERDSNDTGSLIRTIGIGALVTAIAGLGVYALLPTAEPELEVHRAITADEGEAGVSGAAPALAPEAASAEAAQAAEEPALPMPSAATVPAGSAFAVDVREQARPKPAAPAATTALTVAKAPAPAAAPAAPKPAPRAMRFGATSAPSRAQTFALRMSKPIASISGSADAGGFTVVVMGSLSLDRAGPISAAHKGVARAMVLNKGDRSELTIRFADGKRPAYQVRGDGTTLYVVIEDV